MGCFLCVKPDGAKRNTDVIESAIQADKKRAARIVKLLLLGAGESGKSTIVKQMKIIHNKGYSREECLEHRSAIYSNTKQSLSAILGAMERLGINFARQNSALDAKHYFSICDSLDGGVLTPDLATIMKRIWSDEGVLHCFSCSRQYQLNDSAEYYLNELSRISQPGYVPTEQDVLRTRIKTSGIVETEFEHSGLIFKMIDVGGQESERKKWILCFSGVTAIIFIVALSEYDLTLAEKDKNRMQDSLMLFNSISNSPLFVETSMILLLNKMDLFENKIHRSPLTICFPDYKGPNRAQDAAKFIEHKFKSLNKHPDTKEIYSHFTCATDTQNIRFVFRAVTDVIVRGHLRDAGLL